jgi:hypothetical protein
MYDKILFHNYSAYLAFAFIDVDNISACNTRLNNRMKSFVTILELYVEQLIQAHHIILDLNFQILDLFSSDINHQN